MTTSLLDIDDFRQRLRLFLAEEMTPELRRQNPMDKGLRKEGRELARKLGELGWLGVGWPTEYGGSGGSIEYEIVLAQEFARHQTAVPNVVARMMAGPVILRRGSEAMKREFIPRIARGEIEFALGYTEPNAGSDLSALSMYAEEFEDHFRINGQKTFQTESHYADYHWLAVRTDRQAAHHNGITLMVVDQRAPGITIHGMDTLGGERTNTVFYDDVRVPKSRVVGECGRGFHYVMEALDFERIMLIQSAALVPIVRGLIEHTANALRNGKSLAQDDSIRRRIAWMTVELEAAQAYERHAQKLVADSKPLDYVASIVKLFSSELRQKVAYTSLDILGSRGRLEQDTQGAPMNGEISRLVRASVVDTIGAGTSEILRNIIATRGLGLPRD